MDNCHCDCNHVIKMSRSHSRSELAAFNDCFALGRGMLDYDKTFEEWNREGSPDLIDFFLVKLGSVAYDIIEKLLYKALKAWYQFDACFEVGLDIGAYTKKDYAPIKKVWTNKRKPDIFNFFTEVININYKSRILFKLANILHKHGLICDTCLNEYHDNVYHGERSGNDDED